MALLLGGLLCSPLSQSLAAWSRPPEAQCLPSQSQAAVPALNLRDHHSVCQGLGRWEPCGQGGRPPMPLGRPRRVQAAVWISQTSPCLHPQHSSLPVLPEKQAPRLPLTRSLVSPPLGRVPSCAASAQQARVIVNNALKLYSQDKTGMVDFALESGGE